ncbi:ATP-dependent DNA helicase pfh1 [Bienertia sinuspersici]
MLLQFSYVVGSIARNYCTKVSPIFPFKKPQKSHVKRPRTSIVSVQWTDQQLQVFDAIERRQSVFITGSAGTGKTMLIQEIIKLLRKLHGKKEVSVTAPTGIVACSLGGQTLHSFAGVGLAEADAETLLSKVLDNKRVLRRWRMVKALVVDEISMVEGEFFDKLEYLARMIRENDEPWGGIQLVVSGDFLQLPPISVGKKKNSDSDKEYAFEADSWDQSFQLQVGLNTIFRQSDPQLIKLLQGIRKGELDDEGLDLLEQCRCMDNEPDETVVRLFPRIADVSRVNDMRLKGLGEEIIVYEAFDRGERHWIDQLDRGIAPNNLQLCKGARVMLTKNLNVKGQLVNGATGKITGFKKAIKGNIVKICDRKMLPIVKFDCGTEMVMKPLKWNVEVGDKIRATRLQLPLILAWAMSIHKSQGMTVDRLHTNLSKAFGFGMIYVALSRLRSLDGLSFSSDFHPSKIKAHPKVLEYYKNHFE